MLLLGKDVGISSVKVSVVDGETRKCFASAQYPEKETEIIALQPGLGGGFFNSKEEAFGEMKAVNIVEPENTHEFEELYRSWKVELESRLQNKQHQLLTIDPNGKKIQSEYSKGIELVSNIVN